MRKRITVTKTGIKRAVRGFATCPIARAARRVFGTIVAGVTPRLIIIRCDYNVPFRFRRSVALPLRAQVFIQRYDNKLPVKPFSFWVEVPQ